MIAQRKSGILRGLLLVIACVALVEKGRRALRTSWQTLHLIVLTALASTLLPGCLAKNYAGPRNALVKRLQPKPIPPGPNGLYMDIIHLERPFGDPELNNELWVTADEEPLAIATRETLATYGLRVGVLGGSLPPILKTLFDEEEIGQMNGEHLQLQHATPTRVQTGGVHASWPKESAPAGATEPENFVNAVGTLRLTPRITTDGSVDLVFVPEIQHGDPRKLFVPNYGLNGPLDWSIQIGRQYQLLEDLTFTVRLRGGQYAMVGCYGFDRESLGARFFSRMKDGQTMQRVVLIQAEPSQEARAARSLERGR